MLKNTWDNFSSSNDDCTSQKPILDSMFNLHNQRASLDVGESMIAS